MRAWRDDAPGYDLLFFLLGFFLADVLPAFFAVVLLAPAAFLPLPLPFPKAASQPSLYFFVAPTRTIVTAVVLVAGQRLMKASRGSRDRH
jgi:hypothetical protein